MPAGVRAPDFTLRNQDGEAGDDAVPARQAGDRDLPLLDLHGHLPGRRPSRSRAR